jgi:hypothetical protein
VARHPANNIIVSRIKGRLLGEDLAIFYRVLRETGLGEFERFDTPGGDETRSRDEAAAIKALDIGNSEKHEILGKKLNLIDVLPSALNSEQELGLLYSGRFQRSCHQLGTFQSIAL